MFVLFENLPAQFFFVLGDVNRFAIFSNSSPKRFYLDGFVVVPVFGFVAVLKSEVRIEWLDEVKWFFYRKRVVVPSNEKVESDDEAKKQPQKKFGSSLLILQRLKSLTVERAIRSCFKRFLPDGK